jgi:hypothetical protein
MRTFSNTTMTGPSHRQGSLWANGKESGRNEGRVCEKSKEQLGQRICRVQV